MSPSANGRGPRDALPAMNRVPGGLRGGHAEELDHAFDVSALRDPLDCLRRPEMLDFFHVIEPELEDDAEIALDDRRHGLHPGS